MTSRPSSHARRRRVAALAAAAAVPLIVVVSTVAVRVSASTSSDAADDTVVGPPLSSSSPGSRSCTPPNPLTLRQLRALVPTSDIAPTSLGQALAARQHLRALAAAISPGPCDTAGRYDYVQLREWVRDSRTTGGRTTSSNAVLQYESWLAADSSGRAVSVGTRTPAAENRPMDETYAPGADPAAWAPLPTDERAARAKFGNAAPGDGAQARLNAIADINQQQVPPRLVRAALLAALSDTDGITYHGPVVDRAGRRGVAVAATSGDGVTRDLLILDSVSGNVLAYEQSALRDPGRLGITAPTVLSYKLYLGRDHTDTVQRR